jgi:hypothetical protein
MKYGSILVLGCVATACIGGGVEKVDADPVSQGFEYHIDSRSGNQAQGDEVESDRQQLSSDLTDVSSHDAGDAGRVDEPDAYDNTQNASDAENILAEEEPHSGSDGTIEASNEASDDDSYEASDDDSVEESGIVELEQAAPEESSGIPYNVGYVYPLENCNKFGLGGPKVSMQPNIPNVVSPGQEIDVTMRIENCTLNRLIAGTSVGAESGVKLKPQTQ